LRCDATSLDEKKHHDKPNCHEPLTQMTRFHIPKRLNRRFIVIILRYELEILSVIEINFVLKMINN
jgi:hypothetical protein